jgi:NAD(P)-dependent dehydrogenase (short-subunit alcohol dehydrogenase family)
MTSSSPVVILTGASRGLGLAILRILLERYNARVVTISRTLSPELEGVQREFRDRVHAVQGDVGSSEDNQRAVKTAVDTWGGVDGIIINAGSLEPIGELAIYLDIVLCIS